MISLILLAIASLIGLTFYSTIAIAVYHVSVKRENPSGQWGRVSNQSLVDRWIDVAAYWMTWFGFLGYALATTLPHMVGVGRNYHGDVSFEVGTMLVCLIPTFLATGVTIINMDTELGLVPRFLLWPITVPVHLLARGAMGLGFNAAQGPQKWGKSLADYITAKGKQNA
jgi:hypothetical protein